MPIAGRCTMGDMADWLTELHMFDDDDNDYMVHHNTVRCKYCGRDGFVWFQFDDSKEWRLVTLKTNTVHKCGAYDQAKEKRYNRTRRK